MRNRDIDETGFGAIRQNQKDMIILEAHKFTVCNYAHKYPALVYHQSKTGKLKNILVKPNR